MYTHLQSVNLEESFRVLMLSSCFALSTLPNHFKSKVSSLNSHSFDISII